MSRFAKYWSELWEHLANYPTFGCENTDLADKLVSFLLVISPLLQHYRGVGVNAGILVLVLCLPYIGVKLLLRLRSLRWKNLMWVLPLILFQVFRVVAHGTTLMEVAHGVVLCGYFTAIALGGINLKYVARWSYLVAMVACLCIILQSLCYYLFGFHLQMVVTEWLLEESSHWIRLAETGLIDVTGKVSLFYRPSAFFLEPSHMFLYFTPHLCLLLLTPDMNQVKGVSAAVLSLALILSTSGMGIALILAVWLLHLGFGGDEKNVLRPSHLLRWRSIRRCLGFLMVFGLIAVILPFLRYGILRIFMSQEAVNNLIGGDYLGLLGLDAEGSTAISGRTQQAISLIVNKMQGLQYLIGVSDSVDDITFNLPGFFATIYKYGFLGMVLSYVFYLCCAVFAKGAYRWMAIIILGISFFTAHTHGTFYMIFYIMLLMDGLMTKGKPGQADHPTVIPGG